MTATGPVNVTVMVTGEGSCQHPSRALSGLGGPHLILTVVL